AIICVSGGWVSSRLSMPLVTRILTNSWPRAPGMNCRANSADIIMALMAMTNLTAILLLSPTVRIIASDYLRQRRLGIQPTFDATRYPDIDQQLAPGTWNELPRE
ncbi:alanine:cation symporter family protein, partial [Klebsiella pneumoniae]